MTARRQGSIGWAVLVLVAGLGVMAPRLAAQAQTTVFLVRHAEKAAEPVDDPPLTPAGEERARALLATLADAGVEAIYVTQYQRTFATAEPLAGRLGITPVMVANDGDKNEHAKAIARDIRARQVGKAVLVVGHSNTLPPIIRELGGAGPPALTDVEYDGLYVLTLKGEETTMTVRARYGAPNPEAAPKM